MVTMNGNLSLRQGTDPALPLKSWLTAMNAEYSAWRRTSPRITEDAEEVAQNAFVKAFQNLSAFRGDSRFYTWLVRIVVNEALVKIRRRRHKEVSIDDPNEDQDYRSSSSA